ncbi:MAG: YraN family protein [Candidatus Abyssubacteria bacterium]|nr:YraN family protein [Candidatus Abyssubacteria bacterium]
MAAENIRRGMEGEERAVRALKKKRYKIIERNFRTPAGEIDIVARDGECLVFVEVRTRGSIDFGTPQETVAAKKRKKLCTAARWYLQKKRIDDAECRFDVVGIVMKDEGGDCRIEVIKDAFRPEKGW